MSPVNNLFVSKTSWSQDMSSRRLQDLYSRCLEDVFTVVIFPLPRCLQDVFGRRLEDVLEDEKLLRWRRLEDVLKTCLEHVFKTSWRPANVNWVNYESHIYKSKTMTVNFYKYPHLNISIRFYIINRYIHKCHVLDKCKKELFVTTKLMNHLTKFVTSKWRTHYFRFSYFLFWSI